MQLDCRCLWKVAKNITEGYNDLFWKEKDFINHLYFYLDGIRWMVLAPSGIGALCLSTTVYCGITATWGKIGIKIIDQSFSNWSDLERLKRENESLKAEQSRYSGILAENIRLRHLLKFREGYTQFNLLGASVIGRDYGTWTNTMVIDCGVNQGLKKYMPVIVPEGLVGFVSEVYTESARVQLLIDPRTMVGGIIQRPASRVASMVSGNTGKLGVLSFVNIVKEDDVIKGDVVITSGYGGVYPKGLVIGSIQQVTDDSGKLSLDADIKPAVDFGHLEEVFVIMDSIRKTLPQNIDAEVIQREPPMNPNLHQAGAENE